MRKGKILTVLPTDRQDSLEEWKFSYVYWRENWPKRMELGIDAWQLKRKLIALLITLPPTLYLLIIFSHLAFLVEYVNLIPSQGLCPCCSCCLDHSSSGYSQGSFCHLLQISAQMVASPGAFLDYLFWHCILLASPVPHPWIITSPALCVF